MPTRAAATCIPLLLLSSPSRLWADEVAGCGGRTVTITGEVRHAKPPVELLVQGPTDAAYAEQVSG